MGFLSSLANLAVLSFAQYQLNKSIEEANAATDIVDPGVRLQLNPSTDTKIPVLYGDAFFAGNLTDVEPSTDLKTFRFVLTLAELTGTKYSDSNPTAYTFHDVYLNNNRVVWKADGVTVDYTVDTGGNQDINMRDLVKIYFYAGAPLQPDGEVGTTPASDAVMVSWDAINHPMTNLMYAIIEVTYNQSKGVTGLPNSLFHVSSDMNLPGDVLYDYMLDDSYGANIPVGDIDTAQVTALNSFCTAGFDYTDALSVAQSGPIDFNGLIDTSTECLTNMSAIAKAGASWLSYDIHAGKWTVIINQSATVTAGAFVVGQQYKILVPGTTDFTLIGAANNTVGTVFTATGVGTGTGTASHLVASMSDSHIIDEIGITGTSLTNLNNQVNVKYQNTDILDTTDFVKIAMEPGDLFANEPLTTLEMSLPFTNKQSVALKLGLTALKQARVDKIITFKTDFSFINLKAGEIIAVSSNWVNMANKLFRIITSREVEGDDGSLQIEFTALEYVSTVYDYDITELAIETDDGIFTIGAIGQPDIPIVTNNQNGNIPHILVQADVPSGIVDTMEFWLTTEVGVPQDVDRSYVKIGQESKTNGQAFIENETVTFRYNNLTSQDFFIKVRGTNTTSTGPFSDPTGLIEYVPVVVADKLVIQDERAQGGFRENKGTQGAQGR